MKILMIWQLVRYVTMYHFLTSFAVLLLLEVNGITGKSDLKTKLLLQNIRTHLAEKANDIAQQKECESGLTLCKNMKIQQLGEDKSDEIPPPPKVVRGHHKPLIKVTPKETIQTMMPKVHKKLFRKVKESDDEENQKKFLHQQIMKQYNKENSDGIGSKRKNFFKTENILHEQPETPVHSEQKLQKQGNVQKLKSKQILTERNEDKMKDKNKESKSQKSIVKSATVLEFEKKQTNLSQKAKPEKLSKQPLRKVEIKELKDSTKKELKKFRISRQSTTEKDVEGNKERQIDTFITYNSFFSASVNSKSLNNSLCSKHIQIYLRQLKKNKIWALMMYDASAKLPSGILSGNINQYGDFDECLSVNAVFKNIKSKFKPDSTEPAGIRGKYCLANIDVSTSLQNSNIDLVVQRIESFSFIRSTIFDPGHFIPRFSSINWGLCVPSTCPAEDVQKFFESYLQVFNETTGIIFKIKIDEENCVIKNQLKFEFKSATSIAIIFYIVVMGMTICGTYIDIEAKETKKSLPQTQTTSQQPFKYVTASEENISQVGDVLSSSEFSSEGKFITILKAFSLKRNIAKLLSDNDTNDCIECISGIKSVFTIMLYFAHKTIPLGWTPFTNRVLLTKISNEASTVLLRTSIIYTDSFLLISGVLTSYNLSKEILEKKKISWVKKSIGRFIRLTPALFAVVLFYAYIWDHLGSGPIWNLVVKRNSDLCQKYMWRNLLYIQNLFPFEDMCAPQTHQLALDMQLSLIAPLFIHLLYNYDKVGVGILQAFFLISSIMRYISTANNNLSVVIYHGMSVSQLYQTANLLYTQTIYRASPYLMGSIVGYYLNKFERRKQIPKAIATLGWAVALSLSLYCIVSPSHLSQRNYEYNVHEAAKYAALMPVAWSIALSWLIIACHFGYGGKLNEFLSNKSFLVFSRISYSVYLTQFLVFFYKIGVKKIPEIFTFGGSFNITEFFVIIAISVVVTFLFDFPMIEIRRIILKKKVTKVDTLFEENQYTEQSEETEINSQIDKDDNSQDESHELQENTDEIESQETSEDGEEGVEDNLEEEEEADENLDEENERVEEDNELQPLRRSTRILFDDEPDYREWLKIEKEEDDNEENEQKF